MDEELTPEAAGEAVSLFKKQKGNPFEWDWLQGIWEWLRSIWSKLGSLAAEAAAAVWSWVGPWFESIFSWIQALPATIWSSVGLWLESISDSVRGLPAAVWEWVGSWLESIWGTLSALPDTIWSWVGPWFEVIWDTVARLPAQIADFATGMPAIITETLADPITDWFTGLIETIVAIPISFFQFLKTWLIDFPQWMVEDFGERVIYGFTTSFEWVGRWAEGAVGNIIEAIMGYVKQIGRIDPTNAPTVAGGLMTLVGTGVFALSAMTLAGELMHPLKTIGMGHVSAMIGDVINYRVISGAFMGALVGAALTTPLRYYFNYTMRPWLPDRRVMDMSMSRELFKQPETLVAPEWVEPIKALVGPDADAFERRMLGYHGFADEWYPVYKELANTPVGYFALAGIARTGVFDPAFFTEAIQRAGYSPRLKSEFYKMFEYMAKASAQTLYIGDPINAFKEGWFSEDRLSRELIECGIPEESLPRYVHAAWIKYEVDLLSDRLAGLKEAYRKGLVTDTDFQNSLTGWGMVAERAEEHLRREQIRRYGTL